MPGTSDLMNETSALNSDILSHLRQAQRVLKDNQREEAIEREGNRFRNAGIKRGFKFTNRLLSRIEDMEELLKPSSGEEGAKFATKDNVDDVNAAIEEMSKLLAEHREQVQHELNMFVTAATSPLKWKAVKYLEGGMDLPNCVTIEGSEIRKAEKESMAFERDLRNAVGAERKRKAEGKGYGYESRRNSKSARGSRGRGGFSSGDRRNCFRCGSTSHMIRDCTKQQVEEKD